MSANKLSIGQIILIVVLAIVSIIMMELATVKRTIHDRMANTLMVNIDSVVEVEEEKE